MRDRIRFIGFVVRTFKRNPWMSIRVWFPWLVPVLQRAGLWRRVWLCNADDESNGEWIYL